MVELGKLQKLDVRSVWEHEARDFSSWLAKTENLSLLGDQIGIEIEAIGTEADVGRFRIDILAVEPSSGHKIIIENQLEPTNHDHLGKVITYAAGLDAKYLIWIVKDVLPEHLKAIEWLNEHLDAEISCFLIKIEVWQIGDSKPAPRFEVVSIKNDWAASLKRSVSSAEVSDTQSRQLEFWQGFYAFIKAKDSNIKLHSPRPQHWLNFSIGTSIAHIATTINKRNQRYSCDLYISNNKGLFAFLQENAEEIQKQIGSEVYWFEASTASGLSVRFPVDDVFDSENQSSAYLWLYEMVLKFKKVLNPYIQTYKSADAE